MSLSTAGYIDNPAMAIEDAAKVSDRLAIVGLPPVGIELYAVKRNLPGPLERYAIKKTGVAPRAVDAAGIIRHQRNNGGVRIETIHGPFAADLGDAVARWRAETDEEVKPGHLMWSYIFGGVSANMHAVELAERIQDAQQGEPVTLSLHANLWEALKRQKHDQIQRLRDTGLRLAVESAGPDGSTYLTPPQLSEPSIVAQSVDTYDLDGLIIGADHAMTAGIPIDLTHEAVRRRTIGIHLASGERGLPNPGKDLKIRSLYSRVGETIFANPVAAVIDVNPVAMRKFSSHENRQGNIYSTGLTIFDAAAVR